MALASKADDGDFLALDEIDVGIPIVINAHGVTFPLDDSRQREFRDALHRGRAAVKALGWTEDLRREN
jgi:hypothetical protein